MAKTRKTFRSVQRNTFTAVRCAAGDLCTAPQQNDVSQSTHRCYICKGKIHSHLFCGKQLNVFLSENEYFIGKTLSGVELVEDESNETRTICHTCIYNNSVPSIGKPRRIYYEEDPNLTLSSSDDNDNDNDVDDEDDDDSKNNNRGQVKIVPGRGKNFPVQGKNLPGTGEILSGSSTSSLPGNLCKEKMTPPQCINGVLVRIFPLFQRYTTTGV